MNLIFAFVTRTANEGEGAPETSGTPNFWDGALEWLKTAGLKLLIGLIVLFVAFWVVNRLAKIVRKGMVKKGVERTVYTVTYAVIRNGLKILLFLAFLGYVGVDTAGIGSIIASIGVTVGLALQGSLANLAGGIILFLMRPFKLGDYIAAQGEEGTVEEIKTFYTYLVTIDNKVVMIPNGVLSNGNIVNYSKKDLRRVDMLFSVSYREDFERAKTAILDVCAHNELILSEPAAPFVRLKTHGENSIELTARMWTKNADYWTVYYAMTEDVKKRFDADNIVIPYRQLDVHLDAAAPQRIIPESIPASSAKDDDV